MSTSRNILAVMPTIEARRPVPWPHDSALAVCVDTMVEDVHFPAHTSPESLAHKLLAVNLSDLAAMGAEPLQALVSLCAGNRSQQWLLALGEGLRAASRRFATPLHMLEVNEGPLTLTAELHGLLPGAGALTRGGAHPGDLVFVTGALGDAAAGLAIGRGDLAPGLADGRYLRERLDWPTPRLAAGRALRGVASACIDISDGLAADLGHILATSHVGARLQIEQLPLSATLLRCLPRQQALALALAGGDDYELCFCVPPGREALLAARMPYMECATRCVGRIEEEPGLRCIAADGAMLAPGAGWMHFGGDRS